MSQYSSSGGNSIVLERRVLEMGQKGKDIVIVVTLDTKGEEALYLKEVIKRRGERARMGIETTKDTQNLLRKSATI